MQVIDYKEIINRCGKEASAVNVDDICYDSRKAAANSVFVCLTGALVDGHDYVLGAYERGCRVFVAEHYINVLPDDAFVIIAPDTRVALAELSAKFFDYPSKDLKIIGITGTKGKTTSSLLIYNILNESGIPTGYIGSNGVSYKDVFMETVNTTPESHDIHSIMRKMVDNGITTLVMEVSSQALKMARVHGIKFDICVFTNLSPDHIGEFEHHDFEEYKNCKRTLFTDYGADYVVYNADDEYALSVVGGGRSEKVGISVNSDADFKADSITYFRSSGNIGVSFECRSRADSKSFPVALSFPGEFSVYNALTAIAICIRLGLSAGKITKTMRYVRIKGRFETHELPCGATVVIDYAHNGVSLKAALTALRIYDPSRLVCLFGSIGGRTKMRRMELGLVASRDADFCILTSDNPDNESPSAIISEIASYFTAGTCPYVAIPDRKKAIEYALKNARKGDIILLAGKGHESYQLICGIREHFSETEIVEEYCRMNAPINKDRYPLKLSYTAKTALWAGKRLKSEFGKQSEHNTISETWELSVRDDEMAKVLNGRAAGMTLAEYFDAFGYDCVTPSFKKGDRFPLLVKLIDAADVLSVQVHPDNEYAAAVEGDSGKTEMWYVIDAKRDAQLIYGLKDGITREEFAKAIDQKRINAVMNQRPVKAGETFFIPAGMIHAIGAGILIAEIQQNADLTYRVYDFDRLGPDGKLRDLHVDKALDVTRTYTEDEINDIRYARGNTCESGELLANSVYFSARKLTVDASNDGESLTVTRESFVSLLCIDGEGEIIFGGESYAVRKGDSYYLPAGMGNCKLVGEITVILSEV